jgi:hypothetical protein
MDTSLFSVGSTANAIAESDQELAQDRLARSFTERLNNPDNFASNAVEGILMHWLRKGPVFDSVLFALNLLQLGQFLIGVILLDLSLFPFFPACRTDANGKQFLVSDARQFALAIIQVALDAGTSGIAAWILVLGI